MRSKQVPSEQLLAGWQNEVRIGKVDTQRHIIFPRPGAEKQRLLSGDAHLEAREMTCLIVEQALLSGADGLDLPIPIEHSEGVLVQQDQSAAVGQRRVRTDVKLISNFNDVCRQIVQSQMSLQ
jgi:hypothetical protein